MNSFCGRCGATLFRDFAVTTQSPQGIEVSKCVICGSVLDDVIVGNKLIDMSKVRVHNDGRQCGKIIPTS